LVPGGIVADEILVYLRHLSVVIVTLERRCGDAFPSEPLGRSGSMSTEDESVVRPDGDRAQQAVDEHRLRQLGNLRRTD